MIRRYQIKDQSMLPRFKERDFVLITTLSKGGKGSVVVARTNNRIIIKRIKEIKNSKIYLKSDNSRGKSFVISKKNIIGRVLWHFPKP